MGSAADASPCENPETGEEVVLEYSTDGGVTWNVINTYGPTLFPMTVITEPMPPGAFAPTVRFRWRQLSNSGSGWDNWAIDNVDIQCVKGVSKVVYVDAPAGGIVLRSANGQCWLLTVSNAGNLVVISTVCP